MDNNFKISEIVFNITEPNSKHDFSFTVDVALKRALILSNDSFFQCKQLTLSDIKKIKSALTLIEEGIHQGIKVAEHNKKQYTEDILVTKTHMNKLEPVTETDTEVSKSQILPTISEDNIFFEYKCFRCGKITKYKKRTQKPLCPDCKKLSLKEYSKNYMRNRRTK